MSSVTALWLLAAGGLGGMVGALVVFALAWRRFRREPDVHELAEAVVTHGKLLKRYEMQRVRAAAFQNPPVQGIRAVPTPGETKAQLRQRVFGAKANPANIGATVDAPAEAAE